MFYPELLLTVLMEKRDDAIREESLRRSSVEEETDEAKESKITDDVTKTLLAQNTTLRASVTQLRKKNTELKSPKVSKNIPTVAEVTQGEVILFAAGAVETMGKDGIFVLLEGREQTVNYVRTPHRFTLVLSDESLIGKRRAAQRIMAEALSIVGEGGSDEEVGQALEAALDKLTES